MKKIKSGISILLTLAFMLSPLTPLGNIFTSGSAQAKAIGDAAPPQSTSGFSESQESSYVTAPTDMPELSISSDIQEKPPVTMTAAAAVTNGPFTYVENTDGTITITAYSGNDTHLIIPSEIDGKTVTAIGDKAFMSKYFRYLTLPSTLKSIGWWSFAYCKTLEEIVIPEGVTFIGLQAFDCCYNLTSISVPGTNRYGTIRLFKL